MLESIFTGSLSPEVFLICLGTSIVYGLVIAFCHSFKNKSSSNLFVALALLPAMVQTVIMLVNGNVGTGVAVAGAFSLVRFRSAPGNAKEITAIFLAMAVGLACGIGYIALGGILAVSLSLLSILFQNGIFQNWGKKDRYLKIIMPENLDYEEVFQDIFKEYTGVSELLQVKTVNLGSLFELQYKVQLKSDKKEKDFLDALRVRNGNLELYLARSMDERASL